MGGPWDLVGDVDVLCPAIRVSRMRWVISWSVLP